MSFAARLLPNELAPQLRGISLIGTAVGPEAPQESGPTGELRVWGRPGGMPNPLG